MELELQHHQENKICGRTEGTANVTHTGAKTPSIADIKKHLAEKTGNNEATLAIKKVHTHFGSNQSKVTYYAYKNENDYKLYETRKEKKKEAAPGAK
ncbi:MAG TPA: hypothetical protein VJB87_03250 [Candidatus Nanoarchaeia archaeon]|nr:hypothetical protein [Candidatus Nanoarchaeia archaeon]